MLTLLTWLLASPFVADVVINAPDALCPRPEDVMQRVGDLFGETDRLGTVLIDIAEQRMRVSVVRDSTLVHVSRWVDTPSACGDRATAAAILVATWAQLADDPRPSGAVPVEAPAGNAVAPPGVQAEAEPVAGAQARPPIGNFALSSAVYLMATPTVSSAFAAGGRVDLAFAPTRLQVAARLSAFGETPRTFQAAGGSVSWTRVGLKLEGEMHARQTPDYDLTLQLGLGVAGSWVAGSGFRDNRTSFGWSPLATGAIRFVPHVQKGWRPWFGLGTTAALRRDEVRLDSGALSQALPIWSFEIMVGLQTAWGKPAARHRHQMSAGTSASMGAAAKGAL